MNCSVDVRICALLVFLAVIGLGAAETDRSKRKGTENDVQVGRLSGTIPEGSKAADAFVWDAFSKRPETELFNHYSTRGWRRNYESFSAALVEKAKVQHYEWESLRSCLTKLPKEPVAQSEPEEVAYLPIGAYRTTQGKREVWIVFCLWEYDTDPAKLEAPPVVAIPGAPLAPIAPSRPLEWPTVGHIRMFTYDLAGTALIGFVTCM